MNLKVLVSDKTLIHFYYSKKLLFDKKDVITVAIFYNKLS